MQFRRLQKLLSTPNTINEMQFHKTVELFLYKFIGLLIICPKFCIFSEFIKILE